MNEVQFKDDDGDVISVDNGFSYVGYMAIDINGEEIVGLTVDQVKNLMSHLQRALDEYGDRNNE